MGVWWCRVSVARVIRYSLFTRRFLQCLFLPAELLVQPTFNWVAEGQDRKGDDEGDRDQSPLPEAADDADADAGGKPGTGRAGEPADPEIAAGVNDHAGAEKADTRQDALYDAATGVRNNPDVIGMNQRQQHRSRKADQAQRLQADRLAVKVAVEPDCAAGERGDAKTQYDFGPVQQRGNLSLVQPGTE